MIIAGTYSFNGGKDYIEKHYKSSLSEIEEIIAVVDAETHKVKNSREKTMPGKKLFSPISMNKAFKNEFRKRKWTTVRVKCEYPTQY